MAVIASSNFTTLSYIEEDTYGVLPSSGEFRYTPFTGESLQFTKESISSNNINPSRQVSDMIQTGFDVSGAVDIELAAKTFDEFWEGAMWNRWGTYTDETVTATWVNSGRTLTADSGTPFVNIVVGQFVQIAGAVNSANNGVFQVLTVTDTVLTFTTSYADIVDEASTASVTVKGCMIRNPSSGADSVRISYYFEKAMEDIVPVQFLSYSGCMVNSISISAQSSSILTGSIDFMGKTSLIYNTLTGSPDTSGYEPAVGSTIDFVDGGGSADTITDSANGFVDAGFENGDEVTVSGSTSNDGTYTIVTAAAGTLTLATGVLTASEVGINGVKFAGVSGKLSSVGNNILNAVSHVGDIRLDGENINVTSGTGVYFQGIDFTLSNNLRGVQAIGQMGNVNVAPGQLSVTGNMNAFFQDDTMYSKFIDGSEFTLSYTVLDENDEGYVFYFPRVTIASSTMSAGGNDQDLVENMTWSALMDTSTNTSVQIDRFLADYSNAPDV